MHETTAKRGMSPPRRVLILVENLPLPFDRRVWQEACALRDAGYRVSAICPMLKGYTRRYEELEGVHIYRHPLRAADSQTAKGYAREYGAALWHQARIAWRIYRTHPFDAIHACNPPDLLFLVALPFLLLGVRVLFVRSAPDLRKFVPVPPDPRWKAGKKYLVGYLGTIGPQEGLHFLVEAA